MPRSGGDPGRYGLTDGHFEALLEQAMELSEDERREFLDHVCGEDLDLRLAFESRLESAPTSQTSIGHRVHQYRVERRLGGGAMGVVYSAWDTRLDRRVALKFMPRHLSIDPVAKERFLVEARAAARIDHPNICQIHEIGEAENGRMFIAMGYYRGETLKPKLAAGPIPLGQSLDYAVQIAAGLSAAHALGVLHRDIKPANVLITREGVAKVLDFGVAKRQEDDLTLTAAGESVGTLAYMAPEQLEGGKIDQRVDIWSLAVLLFEMLTGRRPFTGDRPPAIMHAIVTKDPPTLASVDPALPPALDEVLSRALSKEPDDRPETMSDFAGELLAISGAPRPASLESGVHPRVAGLPPRAAPWRWAAIGAAAVVAVVFLLTSLLSPGGPSAPSAIAVLPLESTSDDPMDVVFTDGVHDEVISRLSKISELRVLPPTSVQPYRDFASSGMTIEQVADELGVNLILQGSVYRFGNELKITVFLTDTRERDTPWSDTFERERADLFGIQRDVAERIAAALNLTLSREDRALLAAAGTTNPVAYEIYVTGKGYLQHRDEENLTAALEQFERAVEADDGFALAHLRSGYAHTRLYWFGFDDSPGRLERARAAIDRAFELDPEVPEGHLVRAWYLYHGERDYEGALAQLEVAERDGGEGAVRSEILRARGAIERRRGDFSAAERYLREAFELDPRNAGLAGDIGNTLQAMRRYEDAEAWFDVAIEIAPSGSRFWWKAWNYVLRDGHAQRARMVMQEADAVIDPADWPERTRHWVWIEFISGAPAEALSWIAGESRAWIPVSQYGDVPTDLLAGEARFRLGALDEARLLFERARDSLEVRQARFAACEECRSTTEEAFVLRNLSLVHGRLGDRTRALTFGRQALDLINSIQDELIAPDFVKDFAIAHMSVGSHDIAIDWIEHLLARPGRSVSIPYLRENPLWDPLRENARFNALLEGE